METLLNWIKPEEISDQNDKNKLAVSRLLFSNQPHEDLIRTELKVINRYWKINIKKTRELISTVASNKNWSRLLWSTLYITCFRRIDLLLTVQERLPRGNSGYLLQFDVAFRVLSRNILLSGCASKVFQEMLCLRYQFYYQIKGRNSKNPLVTPDQTSTLIGQFLKASLYA